MEDFGRESIYYDINFSCVSCWDKWIKPRGILLCLFIFNRWIFGNLHFCKYEFDFNEVFSTVVQMPDVSVSLGLLQIRKCSCLGVAFLSLATVACPIFLFVKKQNYCHCYFVSLFCLFVFVLCVFPLPLKYAVLIELFFNNCTGCLDMPQLRKG